MSLLQMMMMMSQMGHHQQAEPCVLPRPLELSYFAFRGRGEITRLIFAAAKKHFVDNRINESEWDNIKPTLDLPFGGLPVLNVSGKVFGQGIAIANYVARENGLYGGSNLEMLMIDQLSLAREDMLI